MIPKPAESEVTWSEGVYWLKEGYGGMTKCKGFKDAFEHVLRHKKRGYGKQGRDEIRIVRTHVEVWKYQV